MIREADTIIIGGGVIGASVAYHLAERGAEGVLILEGEHEQGHGSTGKATGGVRSQFETEINIRMSMYSIDFFRDCDFACGYDPRGYLFFATTRRQMDHLKQIVDRQIELGVEGVRTVKRDEIAELAPGLNLDDIVGGSLGSQDGFIDPIATMHGFTAGAVESGASIEFNSKVLSIQVDTGSVKSVLTTKGFIQCRNVVLCTGPWARILADTAGVELPVEPEKRAIVCAKTREPLPAGLPMVIDLGTGFHFRPVSDTSDEVLFAYSYKDESRLSNGEVDKDFIDKVYSIAEHRAPFLFDSEVVIEKCRAGFYENTPDHHAVIGKCDVNGLYLANGFSGHGVMHSPAAGRAVAEIILDGESSFIDVTPLSINRFAEGKLLHDTSFI